MATGIVKTWDGQVAKISSDEYEQLIIAEATAFKSQLEPSIGDELSFRVKKSKKEGEMVLYAKNVQFVHANPHMLSAKQQQQNRYNQMLLSIISISVLIIVVFLVVKFAV